MTLTSTMGELKTKVKTLQADWSRKIIDYNCNLVVTVTMLELYDR